MSNHTILVIWSWRSFLYSSVYSCHLFFISYASVRSIPFLSFIVPIFAWNVPLVSLIFFEENPLFLCIDHWGRLSYLSLLFFGTLHSNGYVFLFLLCLFVSFLFSAICEQAILLVSDHNSKVCLWGGGPPHHQQANLRTPAGCPRIQLNSNTIYQEIRRSVPPVCPPPSLTLTADASCNPVFLLVLLTNWL